jgi:twitching motility protein PilU
MVAPEQNELRITPYLHAMVKQGASDLYLTTGAHASTRVRGKLCRISREPMKPGHIRQLAEEILSSTETETFYNTRELNKGFSLRGVGRFRMNFYFQRGEVSMVIRHIRFEIPTPETLGLPAILTELVMHKTGMILFVGSTGSGKSTSMAALIQHRNERHSGHILTIEDPIEYVFQHKQSIVGQREVGFDTHNYANAMREAMREAPDMIMVGEVRNTETMSAALGFADTGHLVLSTLHATNVTQALERILYLFPSENKQRVLMDLSLNLRAVVAQRLVPGEQDSLHLAAEVMINTPYVAELIRKGNFKELSGIISKGSSDGMQTFDQTLIQLHRDNKISRARALEYATSRNDMEWQLNFANSTEKADTSTTAVMPTIL